MTADPPRSRETADEGRTTPVEAPHWRGSWRERGREGEGGRERAGERGREMEGWTNTLPAAAAQATDQPRLHDGVRVHQPNLDCEGKGEQPSAGGWRVEGGRGGGGGEIEREE